MKMTLSLRLQLMHPHDTHHCLERCPPHQSDLASSFYLLEDLNLSLQIPHTPATRIMVSILH